MNWFYQLYCLKDGTIDVQECLEEFVRQDDADVYVNPLYVTELRVHLQFSLDALPQTVPVTVIGQCR